MFGFLKENDTIEIDARNASGTKRDSKFTNMFSAIANISPAARKAIAGVMIAGSALGATAGEFEAPAFDPQIASAMQQIGDQMDASKMDLNSVLKMDDYINKTIDSEIRKKMNLELQTVSTNIDFDMGIGPYAGRIGNGGSYQCTINMSGQSTTASSYGLAALQTGSSTTAEDYRLFVAGHEAAHCEHKVIMSDFNPEYIDYKNAINAVTFYNIQVEMQDNYVGEDQMQLNMEERIVESKAMFMYAIDKLGKDANSQQFKDNAENVKDMMNTVNTLRENSENAILKSKGLTYSTHMQGDTSFYTKNIIFDAMKNPEKWSEFVENMTPKQMSITSAHIALGQANFDFQDIANGANNVYKKSGFQIKINEFNHALSHYNAIGDDIKSMSPDASNGERTIGEMVKKINSNVKMVKGDIEYEEYRLDLANKTKEIQPLSSVENVEFQETNKRAVEFMSGLVSKHGRNAKSSNEDISKSLALDAQGSEFEKYLEKKVKDYKDREIDKPENQSIFKSENGTKITMSKLAKPYERGEDLPTASATMKPR